MSGPTLEISEQIHSEKYRGKNETFYDAMSRIAGVLGDGDEHRRQFKDILLGQRFLPGGRIQAAIGSPRKVTAFNCFVSCTIPDSADGIMDAAKAAYATMRKGGGIGFDFSPIRYRLARINSLNSHASGAVSHMHIFDSTCSVVMSAGDRRGAMMGVLRVDHPDIEEFIRVKQNKDQLTKFNISVAITDEFMEALENGDAFDLKWEGDTVETIDPEALWNEIMRSTWDWAEPGVLFIDRINEENNLGYCETIAATNPCGEQPLPPNGACLLGSVNLVCYVSDDCSFDGARLKQDLAVIVRAMDNVIDNTIYPLPEQEAEAKAKRRMGIGITGTANALEAMGLPYGSPEFVAELERILKIVRDECYAASVELAKEKGPFPMFSPEYLDSPFIKKLPKRIREGIIEHGIRNSHLTSIAPCGTISLTANNVSSSIEPVFALSTKRLIKTADGDREVIVPDYGYANFGVSGKTSENVTVDEHLNVLLACQKYVDSAVSKTCNIGSNVTWEEFKDVYVKAWKGGAKGITTFRADGKRFGIMESQDATTTDGGACYIDPSTGTKTCE